MLSNKLGPVLRSARRHLGLSRAELAQRAKVSVRLVAEVERGQRPNVSLESALKLLNVVGVSVVAKTPHGVVAEIRGSSATTLERAARAARRRQTWTGRHVYLNKTADDPLAGRSKAKRLAAVGKVSKQAYFFASAEQSHKRVHTKGSKIDAKSERR